MEGIRVNPKLKKFLNYNFWQWTARIIPLVYLVGSLALYFIGTDTLVNMAACAVITLISFLAIAWWWWAMDTIKDLVKMFQNNMDRYDLIHSEIQEVKEELRKQKRKTSK